MLAGLLRRWLFLAGYRQPIAPAAFVTAMLLALGVGLATALAILGSGLTKELFSDHCRFPAAHGRSAPADCVPGALDGAVDPGAPAVDGRFAARGGNAWNKWSRTCPSPWSFWPRSAKRAWASMRPSSRVLDSVMEDRPLAREFRTYQSDLLAGRTRVESLRRLARRLDVSSVSILVSALGAGGTVGQRHRPGPSPPGRRSAGPSPRAGQRLRHGAIGQADVPLGDLLHARDLRMDGRTRFDASFPGCRHLHADQAVKALECEGLPSLFKTREELF